MILTIIVSVLLISIISYSIWVVVSAKNIPDIQKSSVRKIKQKMSRNECIKSFKNRLDLIKKLEIKDADTINNEINNIINGMNKNNNYDIHMAYSRLKDIDDKIKLSVIINN